MRKQSIRHTIRSKSKLEAITSDLKFLIHSIQKCNFWSASEEKRMLPKKTKLGVSCMGKTMAKMIVDIFSDGDAITREFIEREVRDEPQIHEKFLYLQVTRGKIWKNFVLLRLTEEQFKYKLRKLPVGPGAT
jgi:hypothetical protein